MVEELNLVGKWWLPEKETEKVDGNLTFDRHLKRHTLSIIWGPNFEQSEMGNRDRPMHGIILGETSEQQKVTLINCEIIGFYTIKAENILLGAYFQRPEDVILSSVYVTYQGIEINRWFDPSKYRLDTHNPLLQVYFKMIVKYCSCCYQTNQYQIEDVT
jgi:hypothetical protein